MMIIQDPGDPDSLYLLEVLLEACSSAEGGVGAYAFVSEGGVRLLFEDEDFRAFLQRGSFSLVVGVDAVTTPAALKALAQAAAEFKNLEVRAFLHDRKGLFHPKLCWFSHGVGAVVIVGSSNLTVGGLAANWEAFALVDVDEEQAVLLVQQWHRWIALNEPNLWPIDHEAVLARAALNIRPMTSRGSGQDVRPPASPDLRDPVLVAEIPRSGPRWKQANFDLHTYVSFFQAKPGTRRRVFLWHVGPDGEPGEVEVRPTVDVASHNFRVELGAATGLAYPSAGPPIVVFRRVATRRFVYRLLMPDEPGYSELTAMLDANYDGSAAQKRRIVCDVASVLEWWPEAPFGAQRPGRATGPVGSHRWRRSPPRRPAM